MKKVFLPGMIAAALTIAVNGNSAFGQSSGYSNGLSGSAYPVYQTPFNTSSQPAYVTTSGSVGTGATRFAQAPAPNHVHIPPGNYSLGENLPQNLPGTNGSATMQASGTVESYNGAMQPQPQAQAPMTSTYGGGAYGGGQVVQGGADYGQAPIQIGGGDAYSFGSSYGMPGCSTCGPTSCAPQMVPAVVSPCPWIFGANAMIFERVDKEEYVRFTSDPNMPTTSLLSTNSVDSGTFGGYELFAGRYFGCGRFAVVASYWSLFSEPQMASVDNNGYMLRTNLPFTQRGVIDPSVYYGAELPAGNLYQRYDGVYSHRLRRDQDYQNAEINFFSFALGGAARAGVAQVPACGPCGDAVDTSCLRGPTGACAPIYGARCSRLRLAPLAGFRWFKFDDDLEYAASTSDYMYGNTSDDVYYYNNVSNNLYGFQVGGIATYCCGHRISLMSGAKVGVYANDIDYNTYAGTYSTAATVMSNNSYYGQPYSMSNNDCDVAFIGEYLAGVNVCICKGFSANIGYRMIGISGVATATGQIPNDFGLLNDAAYINRNQSIILHGVTLGGTYNW